MPNKTTSDLAATVSRRGFLKLAGASSLASAATTMTGSARAADTTSDGTPEQIHLTWGDDPSREVVVSWASLAPAANPRVRVSTAGNGHARIVHGVQRTYTDGLNGEIVCTYHALIHGLEPDTAYQYEVTADNDSNTAQPFSASFKTAPHGRAAFRFTSYGDLATPNTNWDCVAQRRGSIRPRDASSARRRRSMRTLRRECFSRCVASARRSTSRQRAFPPHGCSSG